MNKKGFTLVELLAVIVILGIVATLAYSSVTTIQKNIEEDMFEKKADIIEEAAIMYGDDILRTTLANKTSGEKYNGGYCATITVKELVEKGYLDKDNDNTCGNGCVVDPNNSNVSLDNNNIIIYYKNKRIRAKFVRKNEENNYKCQ